jgi:hypothetical protein
MRSTLTIDDSLFRELRAVAHRTDSSLKEVVNRALRIGLSQLEDRGRPKRYRTSVFAMGTPRANLDKALQVAASLEDEETLHKLELRK